MPLQILYSTNSQLKFALQRDYFGGRYYAWCSPVFDSRAVGRYSPGASIAPSSDPAFIYRQLLEEVRRCDEHSFKINDQKSKLKALAITLSSAGTITDPERDEIVEIVDRSTFPDWSPLLYVIPYTASIAAKTQEVPRAKRAGREKEFIVEDMTVDDFHVIEFPT